MNIPIKWNITRISSYRRNLASCQKSFPFQINIKKRYYVDQLSATNKHFRNERLDKKCPQRCKKNWSPEKGVSHQEWQEVSDPSVMPSFYQLTTEGKPCQRSRCQHTGFFNCSALRKFWHFFDGIYYVIWHIFKGGPVKKTTLNGQADRNLILW